MWALQLIIYFLLWGNDEWEIVVKNILSEVNEFKKMKIKNMQVR